MFTGEIFHLSEFIEKFGMVLVRDCDFSYVGKVPTNLPRKLVPCGKMIHIRDALKQSNIAGIITTSELASLVPESLGLAVAERPQAAAYALHAHLLSMPGLLWRDFDTEIAADVVIEVGAIVAPRNVSIGAGTVVSAGAILRERSIIGSQVYIGNGSVIGGLAFEVAYSGGRQRILPQAGGVIIEDNVEILANTVVARATFGGFTRIGTGSKIDNLVHIGHDCDIGQNVNIVCGTKFGGRTKVGDDVFIGSNATTSPGITIGPGARVTMGAVVVKDVAERQVVSGHFAVDHMKWLRFIRSALG
jgi:acyl-[acyl carrier protein]--UDP-N-acetylglucosamine O-acyltransferase